MKLDLFIMCDLHIHPPDNYHRKVWKTFTKALRNILMRGPPAFLKSSGAGLFCRPGMILGDLVI